MTLQTAGRLDGGYHIIPAFSPKSAGITNNTNPTHFVVVLSPIRGHIFGLIK